MKPLVPAAPASTRVSHWPARLVSRKALAEFTRSLAVLVAARLPLLDALATAGRQSPAKRMQELAAAVREDVRRGRSLSDSLARHPETFDALYVQLVRVGEMTGRLADMLLRLSAYLEKAHALRRTVRLAMVYPGVIVAVAASAVAFLMMAIVPTFAEMFADFGAELPAPTRALLGVSEGLRAHGAAVLIAGMVLGAIARRTVRTSWGRRHLERASLRLPLVGPLLRKNLSARFCRTLGTLLESGVHLTNALHILASTSGHVSVEEIVKRMAAHVERGGRLVAPLRGGDVFPDFVVQMVAVGEETANLGDMLLHAAGHFEVEVDAAVDTLTAIIEPLLIVVLGVVLGTVLVAMYLPLFELGAAIR
ncbi:MAG: type II secretion system F family protein [Rhodothermales bacterium]